MNVEGNRAKVMSNYSRDYWSGMIQDQSKTLSSATATSYVTEIPTNLSASAESDESSMSDESSESEQEEQDKWMTCYRHCFCQEVGGSIFGIYYETFGGGPQVGFVETPYMIVFKVSRNWDQTWKLQQLPSDIFLEVRQCPDIGDAFALECRLIRRRCEALAEDVNEQGGTRNL